MRTTTNFALPYPESADHTRTWEYWQGLAEAVDSLLAAKFVQFAPDGSVKVTSGGVARPLPFSIYTATPTIPAGGTTPSLVITFPANRFTAAPTVAALPYSVAHTLIVGGVTATSLTLFAYSAGQTVPATNVSLTCLQGLPGGVGRVAPAPVEGMQLVEATAVCLTEGCANAGVPLQVFMVADSVVTCGVCMQPISMAAPLPAP